MSLNAVIFLARNLCYWVWLTYATHSDQILLCVAEANIRWLLMVRNVFWTAGIHVQTWWFLSNFLPGAPARNSECSWEPKNFFSGAKACGPFPHSQQHTQRHHITTPSSHERRAETVYCCESLNILLISKHILSNCLFVLQYCTHLQPLLIFFTSK